MVVGDNTGAAGVGDGDNGIAEQRAPSLSWEGGSDVGQQSHLCNSLLPSHPLPSCLHPIPSLLPGHCPLPSVDTNHFIPNGGIYRSDGTPKPAGSIVETLITSTWNTSSPGVSITRSLTSGLPTFRGFYGRYRVTATITDALGAASTVVVPRVSFPASAGAAQTAVLTLPVAPPAGTAAVKAVTATEAAPVDADGVVVAADAAAVQQEASIGVEALAAPADAAYAAGGRRLLRG